MNPIDYWKLCAEFSIVQAALLICGACPDDLQYEVEARTKQRPEGYIGVRTALLNAVQTKSLKAMIVEEDPSNHNGPPPISLHETLISGHDLNLFLKSKNMRSEFFEAYATAEAPSDGNGQQFPTKLNAAIKAWSAVTSDPELLRRKSPKQALKKWLTDNAATLGLLNKSGKPNQTGIDEICKVANWKPEGGATPTKSSEVPSPSRPLIHLPSQVKMVDVAPNDLDEEIPF